MAVRGDDETLSSDNGGTQSRNAEPQGEAGSPTRSGPREGPVWPCGHVAGPRGENLLSDQALSDADQAASAADQRSSDADQAASDAAARAANAEQIRADGDQRSADAEQAAADSRVAADADAGTSEVAERERALRDRRSAQRTAEAAERALTERLRVRRTQQRSGDSSQRDAISAARDHVAELRDQAAARIERNIAPHKILAELDESAGDRRLAAVARRSAAESRRSAAAKRARELIHIAGVAIETSRAEDRERAGISGDLGTTIRELLPGASDREEFSLYYQPLRELASSRIIGFEALLRWSSPQLGNVPPDQFIPVAEATGQIVDIGDWVLRQALATFGNWREQLDGGDLGLAVNVAPEQLISDQFADKLAQALKDAVFPGPALTLELTERTLVADQPAMRRTMHQIRALNIKLAVDDFGTGFSSLGRLSSLPLDELKIDRIFINGIDTEKRQRALVAGIVAMSRALDLRVVAEGIETEQQRNALIELGCTTGQGYHLGRPTNTAGATALLPQRP